jgi:ribonuclease HI
MITIYTDGACSGNPGPGGYGTILLYKNYKKELSQGYRKTTNNRMELLAVIKGLEALKGTGHQVTVYSDSKYVVDAVEKGWIWNWQTKEFKGKKNVDLWKLFIPLYKKHQVKFKWVKGHVGNPLNERCDELAVNASQSQVLLIDHGFESES